MSKIFKAKFRDEMRKNNLDSNIPEEVWNQEWVVNCQAVGAGSNSIKYLASYVFKVAISNSRIIKVEDHKVFLYIKSQEATVGVPWYWMPWNLCGAFYNMSCPPDS